MTTSPVGSEQKTHMSSFDCGWHVLRRAMYELFLSLSTCML